MALPLTRAITAKTVQKNIGSNVFLLSPSSIAGYPVLTGENTQWTHLAPSGITLIFREGARVDSGFTPR